MSKLFFEFIGIVKGNVSRETLDPPSFIVNRADAEAVSFDIIRSDSRGSELRWEIGLYENMTGIVPGLSAQSGTLLENGAVTLQNNGIAIENFYLRVRDTNRPDYNDGIAEIQFVRIEEETPLAEPSFTVTPLINSVLVNLTPVVNAVRYILDISTDGVTWTNRDNDYDIESQPYEITGLSENTAYQVRITATSDSLLFRDSFSIQGTTTLDVPDLPTPVDITLDDLGSGNVTVGVVYSGPIPVTYVIERNGVQVYSGASSSANISGFVDDTAYTIRVKVQKTGFNDSAWYQEVYTHQNTPVTWLTIEQFGGQPYYKRIDDKLNYVSLQNGTTRITYTGATDIFDSDDLGKRFCGLYAHKNPQLPNPNNVNEYYPNIEGSRYCNVITVENSKNIIVDFQFNLNKTNWCGYIFFDNSKAFSDMLDSMFSVGFGEARFQPLKTYVVPEFTTKTLPTNKEIKFHTGTGQKARIKRGYEDYHQWGLPSEPRLVKQSGTVFNLTISDYNFISHNIDWIPPHRTVAETQPFGITMFGGANIGNQSRIIAFVNNNQLAEMEEIGEKNIKGNFLSTALAFAYSGGKYSGSGILEDVSDYMYFLVSNVKHKGNTYPQFKANQGGGLYYVVENLLTDSQDSQEVAPYYFQGTVKLTTDKTGFGSDITSRTYYPSHVLELTSDNSWYQIGNIYTNYGWGNAGNLVQIGGFVFWQPVSSYWNTLYEAWYSRGNAKKTWKLAYEGAENITHRKLMINHIPRAGQTYTVGRSYSISNNQVGAYRTSRFRGNVNWSAVLNKRWDLINPVTEIPSNSYPLDFQPGDRFTIVGEGSTVYKVVRTDRLEHPHWSGEPTLWGNNGLDVGYYASEYYLDKPLPSNLGLTFQINVIESKAEVLLDGVERPMYASYKSNYELRAGDIFLPGYVVKDHDENTDMTDGNIIASESFGHASYNHSQITMWAKNYDHRGDYRQSSNAYPTPFTVTNPANGQQLTVGPLRKYSKGYTLINSSGFVRQFNPVRQFEIRDIIRKSQGINLSESAKEKVRLYNCTNMGILDSLTDPYLEKYPNDSGAPDMPTPCRDLINSLPS